MNKSYLFLLVMIIGLSSVSSAQSLKRYKAKAQAATEAKDYSRSLEYYQLILHSAEDKSAENFYNAAEAARQFRIYDLAETYYKEVLADTSAQSKYHLTNFHLGSVLKSQGKYKEAKRAFLRFKNNHTSFVSETYGRKVEKELDDVAWASTVEDKKVRIIHLDSTVNTPSSEFSPFGIDGQLYYSSVGYVTNYENTPKPRFTRIFKSENEKQGQEIADDFNDDLKHSAHATFNADGSRVYYTICSTVNASEVRCRIYFREKNGEQWGKRDTLDSIVNVANYTTTHPSIGTDEATGKEILFFASDRPLNANDNTPDMNVWSSMRKADGGFDAPQPVAEVNTEYNDITPFFHSDSQTLYFSSKGHKNLGGFDIYSTRKDGSNWGAVKEMDKSINTSYDDLYYTLNGEGTMAYFSSNRPGSICAIENGKCIGNDIYAVPQIGLRVLTFNKITGEPLFGTEVALSEDKSDNLKTDSKSASHRYQFPVGFDIAYAVEGTKEGYVPDGQEFNTIGSKGGEIIEIKLYLTSAVELDAFTFNKVTGTPLSGCSVTLFEVPSNPMADLDSLQNQEEVSSISYNYPLNFKKRYMVVGTKFGYSSDTFYVDTEKIPVEPISLLDSLYLCKASPGPDKFSLYFYNDEPDRRTRDTTTKLSYTEVFENYLSLEKEFTRAFAYDPDELGQIVRFFEEDVRGGYAKLQEFSLLLNEYFKVIEKGDTVKITIQGFASPRAKNDYNFNLSKRRISSLKNYFRTCHNGLLAPYINRIIIIEGYPNGEDAAPDGIQDDIADRKGSIFSVRASKERRVDIIHSIVSEDACPVEIPKIEYSKE